MNKLFDLPQLPTVPVADSDKVFPVRRVFCVGRNYAAHAAEMGTEVDREAPFYFTKTPWAICASGRTVPYPLETNDYHHEVELVVAIGAEAFRVDPASAGAAVCGYACGFDMTRRDLQQAGKDKRRPWSLGKDVEDSAVIGAITAASDFEIGEQLIQLTVNDIVRQSARLSDMIWSVPELIAHLSKFYHLMPGDLIFTGTPAGVGAVIAGDRIDGKIEGLSPVSLTLSDPE